MAAHIDTGTMVTPNDRSQTLDHLGLVAGMFDELGIGEVLDRVIAQDRSQRRVSVGQAVKAMVLNGLGFVNRTLYLTPAFYADKPTERLLGAGIRPEHLNDDTLGRALDAPYEQDVTGLYALVAAEACRRLGLGVTVGHLDITSFHVDGVYNSAEEPVAEVVHITPGYSRDHRPDLNQVMLNLLVEHRAGIPLLMKPLAGNSSDTVELAALIDTHLQQLPTDYELEYWVADSALYREDNLRLLAGHQLNWITRVPARLTLAQEALRQLDKGTLLAPGYLCRTQVVEYGGVRQRWLILTSVHALKRAAKRVTRQLLRKSQRETQAFDTLCQQRFAGATDAQQALDTYCQGLKVIQLEGATVEPLYGHRRRGRPAAGVPPEVIGYRVSGAPMIPSDARLQQLWQQSRFILATHELDSDRLSDLQVLPTYKAQQRAERGFRFLKDPRFQATQFYLKSPQRLMALLMVMTLCLLVYAALEYRLRTALAEQQQTFPDQRGKGVTNPTARWIFQGFTGIHVLLIDGQAAMILNLTARHQLLINLLGQPYQQLYS
jgi:transposase